MRRWRLHNRFRPGRSDPRARSRARLEVEELEGREVLSPVVVPPEFFPAPETLENVARDFPQGSESSFLVYESDTSTAPYDVVAVLSTTRGAFQVDESLADDYGLTVADNGTATVRLVGRIDYLNDFLSFGGFTFIPADYYSGDADIGLRVTKVSDPSENDAGFFTLKVIPDASPATLAWAATDEVRVRTEPFAFPPGFLALANAPDTDGWRRSASRCRSAWTTRREPVNSRCRPAVPSSRPPASRGCGSCRPPARPPFKRYSTRWC